MSKIESIFAEYRAPDEKQHTARRSLNRIAGRLTTRSRSASPSSSTLLNEELAENKLSTPAFTRVDVSSINGTVSFDHSPDASIKLLIAELEDAGFDVLGTDATTHLPGNDSKLQGSSSVGKSRWSRFSDLFSFSKDRQRVHKENCEACREEDEARIQREQSRTATSSPSEDEEDIGAANDQSRSRGRSVSRQQSLVKAIFAIEGMTCS